MNGLGNNLIVCDWKQMCSLGLVLGGEGSEELVLLLDGLELTVSELGGGIDELDVDLLEGGVGGLREDGFSEDDGSLSGSDNASLNHNEVVVDNSVVGETSKRGDVLLDGISLGGGVVLDTSVGTSSNSVDLFVLLSSVVIAELTSSGDGPLDGSGMPSTDTTDLSETSVSLSGHSGDTESLDDTFGSLTSGDSNSVDHFEVIEDFRDGDLTFEFAESPVDLLGNGTTVDLDLEEVSLSLSEVELVHLGGGEDSDDLAVLLDSLEVSLDGLLALLVLLPSLGVLGEGLLLGLAPVLVESSLDLVGDVLSPDSGESSQASGGLDVTNKTNDLHGGSFDDGDWLNDISLDDLLTLSLLVVSGDVGHASLVSDEGGKVDGGLDVVSGEGSDSASVVSCSSSGEVGKGA